MNPDVLNDIQARLDKLERTAVRYRAGEITDLNPLSVALGGSSVAYEDVRTVDGGIQVGDQVAVIVFGNDLLILGRLPGRREVTGSVSSAGAVTAGEGFSSVKDTTGRYTVTFDEPFLVAPTVLFAWADTATGGGAQITAKSTSAFSVVLYNTGGTVIDNAFEFIAREPT